MKHLAELSRVALMSMFLGGHVLLVETACAEEAKPRVHAVAPHERLVPGQTFPALKFTAADGRQVDLTKLRGKVVLIDFWATWCRPCIAELPNVKAAYEKHHEAGFEVIGVNLDTDRAKLDTFIHERDVPWPQHFDGGGWKNELAQRFDVHAIPAVFLLDADGVVRFVDVSGEALDKALGLLFDVARMPADAPAPEEFAQRAKTALAESDALHVKHQYAAAVMPCCEALLLLEKLHGADSLELVAALGRLAHLYESHYKRAAMAEALYEHALAIQQKHSDSDALALAASRRHVARLYHKTGRYTEAAVLQEQTLPIYEANRGKEDAYVAQVLYDLAHLYAQHLERPTRAESLYRRSLTIQQNSANAKPELLVETTAELAALYAEHLHNEEEAMALYSQGIALCEATEALKVSTIHFFLLTRLGILYEADGDAARSESLFARALAISERTLPPDHPYRATAMSNLAMVYRSKGDLARAEPLFARALALREKVLDADDLDTAASLNHLAAVYRAKGEHTRALPLAKRALSIYERKLGAEDPSTARSLHNLALTYHYMGDYAQAETHFTRAVAIYEKVLGPDDPTTLGAVQNLGSLYHHMGKYAQAEAHFTRALAGYEKTLGRDHPDTAQIANNLGHVLFETGRFEGALVHLMQSADSALGRRATRGTTALGRSQADAETRVEHVVDGALCLSLKLGNDLDALALSERGRAAGLRELLAEARARAEAPLSVDDQHRVTEALTRITALGRSIDALATKGQPTEAQRLELTRAEIDYDQLLAELTAQHEQFVATQSARGLSTEEAVASPALDEHTAVVTWHTFHDITWGCVVRRSGVHWVDLSDKVKEKEHQEHVRRARIAGGDREVLLKDAAPHLLALYETHLRPLEKHLEGVKHLIVLSQDWAATTPLEMLLTENPQLDTAKPEAGDPANWPWLSNRYTISYATSITTLDILARERAKRRAHQWDRPLLVLGDPPFSDEQLAQMQKDETGTPPAESATGLLAISRAVRFDSAAAPPRLPGTRYEAQGIVRAIGADRTLQLIGPDASERKLFELSAAGELGRCRYIHLATHGFIDPDRPEWSGLVLARAPADAEYDGVLHMREVFELKLRADLVVLSACQTGLGKQMGGDGVVGLSTAFFFAGTPTVVMSLWKVDDLATALLMQRFYQNLAQSQSKADALHEAKRWLRTLKRSELDELIGADANIAALSRAFGKPEQSPKGRQIEPHPFAHPYHWAGFVLTGDPK